MAVGEHGILEVGVHWVVVLGRLTEPSLAACCTHARCVQVTGSIMLKMLDHHTSARLRSHVIPLRHFMHKNPTTM